MLVANGAPTKSVARHLGIGESSVNQQLDQLRSLMHAENRSHLVAKAFSIGFLKTAGESVTLNWAFIADTVTKRAPGDISHCDD